MKKFRITVLLALIAILSVFTIACTNKKQEAEPTAIPTPTPIPYKEESAVDAVKNMKVGWNLGNTLDSRVDASSLAHYKTVSDFETAWGNPVTTKEAIAHVKELGFGTVRVPVTWFGHYSSDGTINEDWLNRVEEVVNYVLENDMYCIINVHHDTGEKGWLKATTKHYDKYHTLYEKLWTNIAERFKDYPEKLIFEGFNEMLDDKNNWSCTDKEAHDAINNFNQSFVNAVRATGGNNATRNLICNNYAAACYSDDMLKQFKLPTDTVEGHLIAEVHTYAPNEFALYGHIKEFTASGKSEVEWAFTCINKYFVKKNIPVIIGEFGSMAMGNNEERAKYSAYVVQRGLTCGVTCILWDNGEFADMCVVSRTGQKDPGAEIIEAIMKCFE